MSSIPITPAANQYVGADSGTDGCTAGCADIFAGKHAWRYRARGEDQPNNVSLLGEADIEPEFLDSAGIVPSVAATAAAKSGARIVFSSIDPCIGPTVSRIERCPQLGPTLMQIN